MPAVTGQPGSDSQRYGSEAGYGGRSSNTGILKRAREGDGVAAAEFTELMYRELRPARGASAPQVYCRRGVDSRYTYGKQARVSPIT